MGDISFCLLHRQVEMKKIKDASANEDPSEGPGITAILSYSKGFVCSLGPGTVCLFENSEENSYKRSREVQVIVNAVNSGTAGSVYVSI